MGDPSWTNVPPMFRQCSATVPAGPTAIWSKTNPQRPNFSFKTTRRSENEQIGRWVCRPPLRCLQRPVQARCKATPGIVIRSIMCSGPFRGASGTQQFARLHRKGPHRLGAWRSGTLSKSCRLRAIYHKLCGIRAFCVTQCTKHRHQSIREIPTGVPFPQVLDSHRC